MLKLFCVMVRCRRVRITIGDVGGDLIVLDWASYCSGGDRGAGASTGKGGDEELPVVIDEDSSGVVGTEGRIGSETEMGPPDRSGKTSWNLINSNELSL